MISKRYLFSAALLLAAFVTTATHAMTIETRGNTVYATGELGDDYVKFKEAFAQPGIKRVVFVNSPGGDLWNSMHIGHLIRERGLDTVAAGYCVSGCTVMFMGGKERSFSDAFRPEATLLGLHGPHNRDTKVVSSSQAVQIYHFLKESMGDRFNSKVMEMALYEMDDADSLLRVFDATRPPKRLTFHCRSALVSHKDCTILGDQDALSLGFVTTNAYAPIDLPASFPQPDYPNRSKPTPTLAGWELYQTVDRIDEFLRALSSDQCSVASCRSPIMGFAEMKQNRAIAIPVNAPKQGGGWAWGLASANEAFVRSIYSCNHVSDRPARLCEGVLVNDFDIRDIYKNGAEDHSKAQTKLTVPSEKFYADEESGGSAADSGILHAKNPDDIPPPSLDGIKTVGTQELAIALKSPQPPVLIDVANTEEVLPGALSLLHGGVVHEDFLADASYESRFVELLRLLSRDKNSPVVFYSKGRDWYSANAAIRAARLGYKQVGWYRGGLASWKSAQLPLAHAIVRAVVE